MIERNATRRYDLGGLHHVILKGIEVSECATCGSEAVAIPRIVQLHRVLAEQFVKQQRMLAPSEIRFLRKHIGLSSLDLATRMGVTRETVSRWESGAQSMGPGADRLLRVLLMTHEPTDNYLVDDLLKELTSEPVPATLSTMSMRNSRTSGWRPDLKALVRA